MKRQATLAAGSFLLYFSLFALTGPGHLGSIDGKVVLQSTRNLLKTGSAAVPPDRSPYQESITPRGIDGRYYPIWGPGLVLAHVPTLVVARHLEFLRPSVAGRPADNLVRDQFFAPITSAWSMAAGVALLALCATELGFGARSSAILAALVALGSPLWHYGRFDTNEPLQCVGLIGATWFSMRERRAPGAINGLLAGALLGTALAAKAQNAAVIPFFVLYALATAGRRKGRALAAIGLPLASIAGALAALNYSRYGSPFETGYHVSSSLFDHPLADGAMVLLFSAGFGLFVFCPALLLLALGGRFARRFPAETALIAAVFVTHLVVDAKYHAYWGCAWGPRFLVPTIPLLALPLLPLIAAGGWRRAAVTVAFTLGVAIQAVTIPVAFWSQVMGVWGHLAVPVDEGLPAEQQELQRIETLIHSTSAAPPRVALWLLENTRCRDDPTLLAPLTRPPWAEEFPWRDPRAANELANLAGLDVWTIPSCWKPPGFAAVLPTNPRLAWLLLGVAVLGAALSINAIRERPSRGLPRSS